ncbi:MAG: hypothetical protein LUF90_06995 [Rikenellaceae bacterium]|nr:hypothetical protein [Rikenellaceae bacterium]
MHGSQITAGRAFEFFYLSGNKTLLSILTNIIQIFQQTHSVFCAVSLIESLQPFARPFTLITVAVIFVAL